jgi:FdhE protein
MPYAALPPVDRATLRAIADARWNAMLEQKPELAAAVGLQRRLIGLVIELAEVIEAGRVPRLSLPPKYLTAKLGAGIPALTGEPIQVPADTLRPTLVGLVRALADGGGGEATAAIRSAIEEGRIDVGALLTLAFRREQGALRTAATRAGLGHDLLWLVADLAVGPFAHALLRPVFGAAGEGSPVKTALDAWSRGYCPLCGSWPAFAEVVGNRRGLRCAFCAATWQVDATSCLYCSESGASLQAIAPDSSRPGRMVEMCRACRGYTKVLPASAPLPFPLLALADLESMDLDLAAMQRGCARPAIKQFGPRR